MTQVITKSPRIEVVDALRGFAVIAILLVHSIEHFIFPVYPTDSPAWLQTLDLAVFEVTFSLFAGKAYAIFALLFGFTFYIQQRNQLHKGNDFGYRYLWRLLLLVGFATLNAAFFPAGDVLLLFSITGVSLFIVRNWNNKTILITCIICLMQPIEVYHLINYLVNSSYTLPDLQVKEMYATIAESTKSGDFLSFIWNNITTGQKASLFWAINGGRFIQTIGLFLLGYLIARKELFITNTKTNNFWGKTLIIGAIAFAPLLQLKTMAMGSDSEIIQKTIGNIFDMWQKLAFTFVLVSSFVLLYQNERIKNVAMAFALMEKMSLTNYVTQSIMGAIIYFPFGLYLSPYCGYTLSLLIGVLLVIMQIQFCAYWLKSHKQGPLESIWHKLTWINNR